MDADFPKGKVAILVGVMGKRQDMGSFEWGDGGFQPANMRFHNNINMDLTIKQMRCCIGSHRGH